MAIVYKAHIDLYGTKIDTETDMEYDATVSCAGFTIQEVLDELEDKVPNGNFVLPTEKYSMSRVYQFNNEWDALKIRNDSVDVTWKFTDLLKKLKERLTFNKLKER